MCGKTSKPHNYVKDGKEILSCCSPICVNKLLWKKLKEEDKTLAGCMTEE